MSETNELKRSLGLKLVVVMVVGNVLGSGVYKKVAPMMEQLHSSGWVLICWVLGGVITLFGALSNAEVAGLLAATGGEYVYYKKIYNKFFAFLFGWSLFTVIQTAAISALAYVFAESFQAIIHVPSLFPSLSELSVAGVFFPFANVNIKVTAILLIAILSWINTKGVKTGAGVSTAILVMVCAGIFTIIAFGLTSQHSNFNGIFSLATTDGSVVTVSSIFTTMLAAFWAYQGWASIGYVGGEIKDANKNIPKGIAIGMLTVIGIYLLVNFTYLSLLDGNQFKEINSSGKIAAVEAVRTFWGSYGALFISLLICLTTLGCTNATVLTSCRTYYAMAKEGMFFSSAGKLNNVNVPGRSLLFQGIWASILVLSGTFDQITDMIIFAIFIYYGATTLGVFILRKKMPDAARPYKVWGYPFTPAIVILFCLALFFNTIYARPREAAIGLTLMLSGVPMYWWFSRKKS